MIITENKTLELKTEEQFEKFVFAISGLTLDEYARKILEQFNEEKEGKCEQ